MNATTLLAWGIIAHLVADWLLQNNYLATYKSSLDHPAAWIHAGIHLIALALVFPFPAAVLLAFSHLLIDTRRPLDAWSSIISRPDDGPVALHVALWRDQVLPLALIALAAALVA